MFDKTGSNLINNSPKKTVEKYLKDKLKMLDISNIDNFANSGQNVVVYTFESIEHFYNVTLIVFPNGSWGYYES